MKAYQFSEAGAARDVLTEVDIDPVEPGPGEVRVRIAYAAVNPTDVKRRGSGRELPKFSPIVTCNDGSGVIEAVGSNVDPKRVGEKVWIFGAQANRPMGTAAETCTLPEWMAPALPQHASLLDGACLGVPAVTAHYGILADGMVEGRWVLVSGGAGRVGHYAVQIAKIGGAKVIATVGNDANAAHAASLGADHVVNYKKDDVEAKVMQITGGEGVSRVCEVAFGANIDLNWRIMAPNAVVTTYSSDANESPVMPFLNYMFKNLTIRPYTIYSLTPEVQRTTFDAINDLLSRGLLKHRVAMEHPFTLAGVVAAHEAIEADASQGVCVIKVADID